MSTPVYLGISRRLRATPFTSRILGDGAKAFSVYNHTLVPTEFQEPETQYWHLCKAVQVWDVGCERQVSLRGPDADRLVQWMTPRDIRGVSSDRCVYLPLADENGRLVNDPIGMRIADDHWWLSIADSDVLLWARGLARGAGLNVTIIEPDVWPLAVQGPLADTLMQRVFGEAVMDIKFFRYAKLPYRGHEFLVARSGWSKQGGYEIYIDDVLQGQALYDELFEKGRDLDVRPGNPNQIERVESTLLSFGGDMDLRHSPIEAGLEAFMDLDKDLDTLSHAALRAELAAGAKRRLRGLLVDAPNGARPLAADPFVKHEPLAHADLEAAYSVHLNESYGSYLGVQVYSPRYRQQLGLAMLEEPLASEPHATVQLKSGEWVQARIVDIPFDFAALGLEAREP